jgi:CBS-domain-containing membrane protein
MNETTAKEIMTRDLVSATEDMTIEEALKALINHRITGLPVINKKGKMMGVISEFDILQQLAGSKKKSSKVFQERIIFSKKVDAISDDTPLSVIVKEFIDTKYRRLPVIDEKGNLVGIITRRDLMKVYYYRARLAD